MSATAFVTPALTVLLLGALAAAGRRPVPVAPDGSFTLRHGMGITALGAVCLAAMVGTFVLSILHPPKDSGELYMLAGVVLFFGAGGGWLLLEGLRARVTADTTGVVASSPWRAAPRALAWRDVAQARVSRQQGYLTLTGRDGTKVKVSTYMQGFSTLLDLARHQLPAEATRDADAETKASLAEVMR